MLIDGGILLCFIGILRGLAFIAVGNWAVAADWMLASIVGFMAWFVLLTRGGKRWPGSN